MEDKDVIQFFIVMQVASIQVTTSIKDVIPNILCGFWQWWQQTIHLLFWKLNSWWSAWDLVEEAGSEQLPGRIPAFFERIMHVLPQALVLCVQH